MKEAIKFMPEISEVPRSVLPPLDPESQQILDAKDKELEKTRSMGGQHVDSVYPNALPPLDEKQVEGWAMQKSYVSPYSGKRESSLTAGQSPAGVETSKVKQPPETPVEPEGSAEAKPNLAKVKVKPIEGRETAEGGDVLLAFDGKDTRMTWFQGKSADGKPEGGKFYLRNLGTAEGALEIPKGTRLTIYARNIACEINITGGKDAGINISDLKELINSKNGVGVILWTPDSENWKEDAVAYEETDGKANFIDHRPDTNEKMTGASPKEAIAYLKDKLGIQPAAGEVPTETVVPPAPEAKPDGKIQAEYMGWLGVDVSGGRGSSLMEKGRQRRLDLQEKLTKLINAVLIAPDAIGREVSDRNREKAEQFRQFRDGAQEAWGNFEARLMMTAEDVSSKTMGAVDKLTKAIGSNIVKALRVDPDAVISGWESADSKFREGIENRKTRADWNEAAAKRMEDRLSQMQEGDRGYDHLRKKAERARATGKRLRKKAEEDRARAEAARGSRKGMFSFLRKPSV